MRVAMRGIPLSGAVSSSGTGADSGCTNGDVQQAEALSVALEPIWALYREYGGSLRVAATIAEVTGKVSQPCLPQPLKTLQGNDRKRVAQVVEQLGLASEVKS